jgi:flagellar basal-body rod protein FlgG
MSGPIDPRSALARAGQALKFWTDRQSVISNNLANANTAGFKGDEVFARLLDEATLGAEATTDFRPGDVVHTGRDLDVALETEGFFLVDTPAGTRLTRNGGFVITGNLLTDMNGNPVLGSRGPVEIPEGELVAGAPIDINQQGTVTVGDLPVDTLRIVRPSNVDGLEKEEGSLFRATAALTRDVPLEDRRVIQGALEESNVNSVETMVDMLDVQRSYRSVERTIRVMDEVMDTITSRLGRVS